MPAAAALGPPRSAKLYQRPVEQPVVEVPPAFGRRCIPPPPHRGSRVGGPGADCVATPSNISDVGYPRDSGSPCRLWSAAAIPCGRLGRFRVVRPQERPRHPRASRQPGKTPLGAVFSGPRPPAAANGSPLRVRACRQPGKTPRRASFSGSTRRQPPMARWVLRPLLRFVIPESPVPPLRHRRLFIRIETTTHGGYLSQVDSPHRPDLFSRAHPAIDPCATC